MIKRSGDHEFSIYVWGGIRGRRAIAPSPPHQRHATSGTRVETGGNASPVANTAPREFHRPNPMIGANGKRAVNQMKIDVIMQFLSGYFYSL
jgi:hypothetical protein